MDNNLTIKKSANVISDRDKFLNTAKSYIGKKGDYICKTKMKLNYITEWCAYAVSAIMQDCGFVGKYIKQIESGAGTIARFSDGKYGTWFQKGDKVPQSGDLIFFRYGCVYTDKYHADHVGIVESVNGDSITTLEGNVDGDSYSRKWAATSSFKRKTRFLKNISVYAFYRPNWKINTSSGSTTSKSIDTIAKEVIAGKWGNGESRKTALTNAGYNYIQVQSKVNELLGGVIKKGNKVKIKSGATAYGTNLRFDGWVYNSTFIVMELSGNRAVIGDGKNITAAIDKSYLTKI